MVSEWERERVGASDSGPRPVENNSLTLSPPHAPTPIAAVFDVDNTLLPGATSERVFISYLIRNGHYGLRETLATLATLVRYARLGPFGALRTHRPYLRGRLAADVARLADEAFAMQILPRLAPAGAARIRRHQEEGHRVALLSGAPIFLVGLLARHLGVTEIIGTPLALRDDRYTGALDGLHPYGARKAILARRFAEERGADLSASYAYADHHSDAEMLALFGHPVCVNATPRLRRIARERGWAVEDWPLGGKPAAGR
jgi:HAD superfamily hydrolase (TIGR01490 family)